MKNIRKELCAALLCLLAAAYILVQFTALTTPKQHDYGSTWGHFLQEEENSIDVLFIGSSLTYCNVVPSIFWEESGLSGYVVSGPELTVPIEQYYLREALRTQSPSVVFFEISGALFDRYTGYTKTVIGQMPWGLNRIKATFNEAEKDLVNGLLFPMHFYHSRWSELKEDDHIVFEEGYTADPLAGYTYLGTYRPYDTDSFFTRETEVDQANLDRNIGILKEMAAECLSNGIDPVFYVSPSISRMPETQMTEIKDALSVIDGAFVLDCNILFEEIGADPATDFYDPLHYNAGGAEKFSAWLGRWTTERLSVEPCGADAALWQSRLDHFHTLRETPLTPVEEKK